MTTEYSVDVDWEAEYDKWQNVGQEVMREFYEEHPKAAAKDGHELQDGEVKYLDEVLDEFTPMMMYAYPLTIDPTFDSGKEKIIKVCRNLPLTVMHKEDDDTYYLALTGGGMNLSQSIARAYQILQTWIPVALLAEISKQPNLSVYGKEWIRMARQIRKQIKMEIHRLQRDNKEWAGAIARYKQEAKEQSKPRGE